jgi:hypothetical protein
MGNVSLLRRRFFFGSCFAQFKELLFLYPFISIACILSFVKVAFLLPSLELFIDSPVRLGVCRHRYMPSSDRQAKSRPASSPLSYVA